MRYGLLPGLLPGLLAALLCLLPPAQAAESAAETAPDLEREQRMAEQIVDAIFDGEPVWLEADGREFLGIYTEPDQVGRAVIVLHGRGTHPDWADVANPLRVGLIEYGWATLSLQMPVLAKDSTYYDYMPIFPAAFPRIEAGIAFLREQGYENIVLAAHSCGVHMAMAWLKAAGDDSIDGFVGIGMGATDYQQPMPEPFALDQIGVPVLDVFGGDEFPAVLRGSPDRLQAISHAGNPHSRQIVIPGANHYFTDMGEPLTATVGSWLDQLRFD